MLKGWLRLELVEEGVFSNERTVTIKGKDAKYQALVHESNIVMGTYGGSYLKVGVISDLGLSLFVSLPIDTFTSGPAVIVPRVGVTFEHPGLVLE